MGKRKKSSRGPVKKSRQVLDTTFKCVFCNSESSISTKIDKKAGIGSLSCKNCAQTYQTTANYLTAPVDVYSDWIDACDNVANKEPTSPGPAMLRSHLQAPKSRAGLAPGEKVTAEDDGFIDDEGVVGEEEEFNDED